MEAEGILPVPMKRTVSEDVPDYHENGGHHHHHTGSGGVSPGHASGSSIPVASGLPTRKQKHHASLRSVSRADIESAMSRLGHRDAGRGDYADSIASSLSDVSSICSR